MRSRRDVERERLLLSLLAVIHRDGGQHTDAFGLAQSVADAKAKVLALHEVDDGYLTEAAGLVSNAAAVREQHTARVDRLLARTETLEAEVARLRARVRVEAEDVERAGVTWLHAETWKLQRGRTWARGRHVTIEFVVNIMAESEGRPGLDILDEMAAMEVDG